MVSPASPTDAQSCYSDRYVEALVFAAEQHRHQTKKAAFGGIGIPYITHLMGVSALIWEDGGDEDQAIAGLLHDVLEDTPTQSDDLRRRFGDRVTGFVELCTDANPAEGEDKAPWRARKEAHFPHLRFVDDPAGLLVVLADKVHNIEAQIADARHATSLGPKAEVAFWALFKGGFYGTQWYLQQVRAAIGDRLGPSRLLDRFDTRLGEFAQLHVPGDREQELHDALVPWIRLDDPAGVREPRAEHHYDMDARELARRMAAASELAMTEGEIARQYLKAVYGWDPPAH
jgi:hypothetical protein